MHYRVFGYLGIVRRASIEKEREVRIHHGNVISAQPVYLYNCPHFEAASSKCPYSVKKSGRSSTVCVHSTGIEILSREWCTVNFFREISASTDSLA